MQGLYAIVDTDTLDKRGVPIAPFVEALLDARPVAIQLRNKRGSARQTLDLLRMMVPLCARAGVPVFANDRPDLALLARCDGVHLGTDDVPAAMVRTLMLAPSTGVSPASRLLIGLSTHNADDVEQAIAAAPDYIAIGPIFATSSKERPSPVVGLDVLGALASHIRRARPGTPIVAIGGITLATAGAVGALADCAAVISALLPEEGHGPSLLDAVRDRARALREAVRGGQA